MKKLLLIVILLLGFQVDGYASAGPTEQLRPSLDKLISLLADPSLKGDEHKKVRREKIMGVISEKFHFRAMSIKILGKTWRDLSSEEQDHFVKLMTKLLENNYIGKLESYSSETIEYTGEEVKGKTRATVTTYVINQGAKYSVIYSMLNQNGDWMVYDVNIEGVSLVVNYQTEFREILRKEKYDGLVKTIEKINQSFD